MKKLLAGFWLLFAAVLGHAQSYPSPTYNNLQVNGSTSFGAAPTMGAAPLYPTVPTNAALLALSTATTSTVTRLGFTTAGDTPPLTYTASSSACSLNSGAGDNGSQVQSANGKCWLANFPSGPVNVREFGATGNGSTNDTTAMQAAHNTGRIVYYPHGTYSFTTITMAAGGIVGDGEAQTFLLSTDTTSANDVTFSATNSLGGTATPLFSDFTLSGQATTKTTGAGLYVTAPSGENDGAKFVNLLIYNFPTDLQFGAAATWSIQNCKFYNFTTAGVLVNNTNNPDSGDSVIMGSEFATAYSSGNLIGVYYQASGGLKIIGNKFNAGAYGIFLGLTASASTSDLLITGNSIENETSAGITLSRSSGTANFSNIEIVGNQLAINPYGITTDGSGAFSNVVISGNTIALSSTTGAAISLTAVTAFYVGENTIYGNGGTPSGIVIASSSTNGKIGKNTFNTLTTTLSNSSTTTFYERDKQVVTVSVTPNTAYGPLYVGNASVTFATAYTVAPEVTCMVGTSSGIAAFPLSITKTGFLANAVGTTSGTAISVICQVEGVI